MRRGTILIRAAVLAGAIALAAFSPARAGSLHGTVRVVPGKVAIGKTVTLLGSHMPANTYFALIITVPTNSKSPWKQFIPSLAKTDSHGNMRVRFKMPVLPLCGPASLYVYAKAQALTASLTLTGCKAPRPVPPPVPPKPKKKHK